MNIKELKNWINTIPDSYNSDTIVFRTIMELNDENWSSKDIPISSCGIDEGNDEMYLCDEKSSKILDKG